MSLLENSSVVPTDPGAEPALSTADLIGPWSAPFIAAPADVALHRGSGHVFYFRHSFELDGPVDAAVVHGTALGVYRVEINGEVVPLGEQAPGWTAYEKRLHYQHADVAASLRPGTNHIVIAVGPGWWAGTVAWFGREIYGDSTAVSLDLRIDRAGRSERIVTGSGWVVTDGPVVRSDLIMGERQDLRCREWPTAAGEVDQPAAIHPTPGVQFERQPFPAMQVVQELEPVSIVALGPERVIVDFGQHLSGRVRLRATGRRGDIVAMRHGEARKPDGSLYTANLRTTQQEDRYILSGNTHDVLTPLFAQHGFRYVEITGLNTDSIVPEALRAEVIHTRMTQIGDFRTDHAMVDRLQRNILWSQKSNFLGIPVDCAQRDERLGWTGDIHLFAATALANYDCAAMLESWLTALTDGQRADGAVRDIAPYPQIDPPPRDIQTGQAGWGDAMVGIPWELYLHTGNVDIVRRFWPAITSWLDYLGRQDPRSHLRPAGVYGDWNALDRTPSEVLGTAWYARSARTAAAIAQVLGVGRDAARYHQLFESIRAEFQSEFVDVDAQVAGGTQTAYVVALANDLVADGQKPAAATHLANTIRVRNDHLTTGFVGTAWVLPVLTDSGHTDLAYRVLTQDTYPSWGDQIALGATAVWEHWDTWQPPDQFQRPAMNSFNHFSLATVGQFLFQRVAGINADPRRPGYRHTVFRPHPHAVLGAASAELSTAAGMVRSRWTADDTGGEMILHAPGTATLHLPRGVHLQEVGDESSISGKIELAAGEHRFRFQFSHRAGR